MVNKVSTLLALLGILTAAHSSCHTCQSNRAMCHDERRFTMCSEGISSNDMFECPNGYICTGEVEICAQASAENSLEPTCGTSCDLCKSPGKLFACLSETKYAYCFGGDVPNYGATGICPDGYVCNLNNPEVCTAATDGYASCYNGSPSGPSTLAPNTVSTLDWSSTGSASSSTDVTGSSEDTTLPTTNTATGSSSDTTLPTANTESQTPPFSSEIPSEAPATETSITTPSDVSPTTQQSRDAMTFCGDQQTTGFYRAEGDQSCQEYFYCYLLSGQYLGVKYICPKSKYFDEETAKCQSKKPENC